MNATNLAVVGHPISHSLSPTLHQAAYSVLGLDWVYGSADVEPGDFSAFINSLDNSFRGLSVTMPHKSSALEVAQHIDLVAEQTQSVNTLYFDYSNGFREIYGYNTDVWGIVNACQDAGVSSARHVAVIGSGATAASAVLASAQMGAEHVSVLARTPQKAYALEQVGQRAGISVSVSDMAEMRSLSEVDLAISALPGDADQSLQELHRTPHAVLLDVAYSPWPSRRGTQWASSGGEVVSGLRMLVHQAVMQVRIFVNGSPFEELSNEVSVTEAMFAAVSLSRSM
jgi:shikimate dehydrogenase